MPRLPGQLMIKTECGMPNCRRTFKNPTKAAAHVVTHDALPIKNVDDRHSLLKVSWTKGGLIRGPAA